MGFFFFCIYAFSVRPNSTFYLFYFLNIIFFCIHICVYLENMQLHYIFFFNIRSTSLQIYICTIHTNICLLCPAIFFLTFPGEITRAITYELNKRQHFCLPHQYFHKGEHTHKHTNKHICMFMKSSCNLRHLDT